MNNDIIPVNQLAEDDIIPVNALKETNSENFLQKAIKAAGALVPSNPQELGDMGLMAARQLPMARGGQVNPMTMGGLGAGLNIAGVNKIGGLPQPGTEWGKVMENQVVDPAMIAVPSVLAGGKLLGAGVKGIGSLFDVAGAKANMAGTVRKGAESASEAIGKMSTEANRAMTPELAKIESTGIGKQHFDEALQQTANEIDPTGTTHGMENSLANKVLQLQGKIPYSDTTGPQLQAAMSEMKNQLGQLSSKAQGAFNTIMKKMLPDAFRNIQETRGAVYSAEDVAQPLTRQGTLNKVAKGLADSDLVSSLKDAEGKVPGLNILSGIEKSGKTVDRARMSQKVGGMGLKAGGLIGLEELFRHLWSKH